MGGIAQPPPFTPSPKFLFATHRQSRSAGWVGDAPAAERLQGRQGVGEGGGGRCSLGNLSAASPSRSCRSPTVSGHGAPGEGVCGVCVCVWRWGNQKLSLQNWGWLRRGGAMHRPCATPPPLYLPACGGRGCGGCMQGSGGEGALLRLA